MIVLQMFFMLMVGAGVASVMAGNILGLVPIAGGYLLMVLAAPTAPDAARGLALPLMLVLTGFTFGLLNDSVRLPAFDWTAWGAMVFIPTGYLGAWLFGRRRACAARDPSA